MLDEGDVFAEHLTGAKCTKHGDETLHTGGVYLLFTGISSMA